MTLSNAERQARFRERRLAASLPPIEPTELAALAEVLGSAALAGAVIDRYGSLLNALQAPETEIAETLPEPTHRRLLAALGVLLRGHAYAELREAEVRPGISSWDALLSYLHLHASKMQETFHTLYLDRKNRLIAHDRQSGTIDHCPVYIREVMRRALDLGAVALILAHNHPSGDPAPSRADIAVTRDLQKAAVLLGVALHDHVIIGAAGQQTSLRELGFL